MPPAIRHFLDPVCHTRLHAEEAADQASMEGHTFFFCSLACKEAFVRSPWGYLARLSVQNHSFMDRYLEALALTSRHQVGLSANTTTTPSQGSKGQKPS